MSLVNELIKGLLPENEQREVAVYGGGFKPPTKGHFEVVKTALNKNPNIDKFIVLIGGKERDGISPDESLLIWDIYKKYLPISVEIQLSPKPPIQAVYNYAKNNPEELVLFVIGAREGNEEDFKDIASRTTSLDKYPNMRLETVITRGGVSGTAARNASKISLEKFKQFVPSELSDEEVEEVYDIVSNKVQEILTENASYSQNIDIKREIAKLTKHMIDKGMNIQPLPKLVFKNGDSENAKQFLGKTAYYDPNSQSIVLYTEGRHPKDIVRSFSHEMVHHTQFLEDRLGNITTTNTQEDGDLDKLEQEANLKGTMTFRNWTDSLDEAIVGDKIECDNCDWSWDIVSGGDDLFVCHKCGHDNEPIEENKNKDTFGIKENLGADTAWTDDDNETITLQDILELTKNIKIVNVPTKELATIVLNWDDNPKEIERISQVEVSSQYPILIMVDDQNKIQWILDGNHRAQKALRAKSETIPAKLIKPSNLDSKARKILLNIVDEGKNKDPFGLNAYARELATGLEENEVMDYKIYCDMDGVLVDFESGYEKLTGIDLRGEFKKGDDFWDPISKAGVGFWAGLKWMSDGQRLWDYIKQHKPDLLSAPSREESSRIGKAVWVKHKIPGTKLILRYAKQKQELANPESILIDDRIENINDWESAGGIGILHTSTANTISQLKKLGL